jgi:hypothetical protein
MAEKESPSLRKKYEDGRIIYSSRSMVYRETDFYPILCDLGAAVFGGQEHTGLIQPLPYRAAEVIFGYKWTSSVDIWNLGVIV